MPKYCCFSAPMYMIYFWNTHTMVCATFRPCDGIDAEHAKSSPSALHSTVVASEAGLPCCQYSTPVDPHGWGHSRNFRLELELTVMVISKFCWYDCWYSVSLLSKNEKIVIGKRERLPIIIMHHWQCIIRLISRKLQTKRIITSKCVFAKCFINVLGKDLILGERKKRECIKFKKNSQQSKKSLYSGTGSTVRVCPNFPEERGLPCRL